MEQATVQSSPNWNSIREKYLEGQPIGDIASAHGVTYGAIQMHAHRYGWKSVARQALAQSFQDGSDFVRRCLIKTVMVDAARWQSVSYPDIDDPKYEVVARGRERLTNTAAKLFGWDKSAQEGPTDAWNSSASGPMIDVSPVHAALPEGQVTTNSAPELPAA